MWKKKWEADGAPKTTSAAGKTGRNQAAEIIDVKTVTPECMSGEIRIIIVLTDLHYSSRSVFYQKCITNWVFIFLNVTFFSQYMAPKSAQVASCGHHLQAKRAGWNRRGQAGSSPGRRQAGNGWRVMRITEDNQAGRQSSTGNRKGAR